MPNNQGMRPVMLMILDGWGWRDDARDNAVRQANTPRFDQLWQSCPHAFLRTSGEDVGLPDGQFGNSEVGHLNIGAGRVVMQELPRITRAAREGSLAERPALQDLIKTLRDNKRTCHVLGLVSTGGVHAHREHGLALVKILTDAGIPVALHAWTDGRDVPPGTVRADMAAVAKALPNSARIATVCGRYFPMDRDHRWDRVQRAYNAIAEGRGASFPDVTAVIDNADAHGTTDEFIEPAVIGDYAGMQDGDALICFNFRADRVRQIMAALLDPAFDGFERSRPIKLAAAIGMTRYSDDLAPLMGVMFPPQKLEHLLGDVVAHAGRKQLRMAETEKYPHVTYFLNGGVEKTLPGEDRIMVPSPKVATYDLQPEMSAPELTDRAVKAIESGEYDLIVLNFANADMVGHTGDLQAAIRAVETVDQGLGRISDAIRREGGALLVTADHGNAELMRDPVTGGPHTAHTTNPVPVLLQGHQGPLHDGRLADLAPTVLRLMGLSIPPDMTGDPLIAA